MSWATSGRRPVPGVTTPGRGSVPTSATTVGFRPGARGRPLGEGGCPPPPAGGGCAHGRVEGWTGGQVSTPPGRVPRVRGYGEGGEQGVCPAGWAASVRQGW